MLYKPGFTVVDLDYHVGNGIQAVYKLTLAAVVFVSQREDL